MKTIAFTLILCALFGGLQGQTSGNIAYKNANQASQPELYYQVIAQGDTAMVVEAAVLLNEKATTYVLVMGIAQEGKTVPEANTQINKRVESFTNDLKALGISSQDFYVDLITQNRIYNYELQANNTVAMEKLAGFEIKKNISIQFKEKEMIDKILLVAAKYDIFDLIKVDYLRTDNEKIRNTLFEETTKLIEHKKQQYLQLSKVELLPQCSVVAEIMEIKQPANSYKSYTAYEAASVNDYYDNRLRKIDARKMTTFYFATDPYNLFDKIINPIITEPVIQYSLRLKVRYFVQKVATK
jgi:uncharacterized protein YggE